MIWVKKQEVVLQIKKHITIRFSNKGILWFGRDQFSSSEWAVGLNSVEFLLFLLP